MIGTSYHLNIYGASSEEQMVKQENLYRKRLNIFNIANKNILMEGKFISDSTSSSGYRWEIDFYNAFKVGELNTIEDNISVVNAETTPILAESSLDLGTQFSSLRAIMARMSITNNASDNKFYVSYHKSKSTSDPIVSHTFSIVENDYNTISGFVKLMSAKNRVVYRQDFSQSKLFESFSTFYIREAHEEFE
jgi:hypothetical protein